MTIARLIGFTFPAAGTLALLASPIVTNPRSRSAAAEDIRAKSRAVYAALKSYADTGTVDVAYGGFAAPSHDRHTFKTFYRAPRSFYFDFVKQGNTGRLVLWSEADGFHSWGQATGVESVYPKGQGSTAFVTSVSPTSGSVMLIASLLFQTAGLAGTLTEFRDAEEEGIEKVNGRPCHKLVGVAKSVYQTTGHEVNVRKTTVWIDVETLLIRRIFEDTPRGTPSSLVSRITTTFEPHANPTLDDGRFRFTAPGAQNR